MSIIQFEHMQKSYGNVNTLKDITASVEERDIISIIGPSGTGKSTLLRCLIGLEPITGGKVYAFGNELTKRSRESDAARMRMGMVFQSFNLFEHKTVLENVIMAPMRNLKLPKGKATEEALHLLDAAGLAGQENKFPEQLSGGQKQRVAIVRTLAMHPDIILFDEPTSALDPKMAREIASMIRSLSQDGYTILMVTHDMELARTISTRVFYMDEGIVYEQGTPDEIFRHPQKEKTRTYVQQINSFRYRVTRRNFDFYALNAELAEFSLHSSLSRHLQYALNFTVEELILRSILKRDSQETDITLSANVEPGAEVVEIRLDYAGKEFDAMDDCDDYARTLIEHWQLERHFRYDGWNHLRLRIH